MSTLILKEMKEEKFKKFLATFFEIEISKVCTVTISPITTKKGMKYKIKLEYNHTFEELVKASFKDGVMSTEFGFFAK